MSGEPINVVRFQNKVRAAMGIHGDNPIPTLQDLLPVVVVENDRPEWGFSGLEAPFGTDLVGSPAVAGELSYMGLLNLPNSGMVGVVTRVRKNQDALNVRLIAGFLDATALAEFTATTIVAGGRDSGYFPNGAGPAGQPRSALRVVIGSTVGQAFGAIGHWLLLAGIGDETPNDYFCVLRPGSYLIAQGTAGNVQVDVQMLWRERAQERGVQS